MGDTKSERELSNLSVEELKVLASDIRASILSVVSHNGGHLSSNLGVVETTMSLFRNFDIPKDDVVFDVGHQTYAYKLLSGRDISKIRMTGGIAPFSLKDESEFDVYDSGHAGDALSIAYGIAKSKQLRGDDSYTIAFIGDGSMFTGLTFEALNLISTDKTLKHFIILYNDNGMAISKQVSSLNKKATKLRTSRFYFRTTNRLGQRMSRHKLSWKLFLKMRSTKDRMKRLFVSPTLFEIMGLKYVGPFDGQDFQSLDLSFEKAKVVSEKEPVILHIFTHKGYGYSPAMKDEVGVYHGVNPGFEQENRKAERRDLSEVKIAYLEDRMKQDEKSYIITPAMEVGSNLSILFNHYPDRSVDVGIAEENAVSYAAGLSLGGMHPMVDIYSTFMQRSYDEIFEDVVRNNTDVLFFVERAGLVGEDGATHQGLYDVAMLRSIPHTHVYMPFDEDSFRYLLKEGEGKHGAYFYRLSKDEPKSTKPYQNQKGVFVLSHQNRDTLVLGVGPKGSELLESLDETMDKRMITSLLPTDGELDSMELLSYPRIVLYDPYSTLQGTVSVYASYLLTHGYHGDFSFYAFPNDFVTFGQVDDLYDIAGLSPKQVRKEILHSIEQKHD